MGTRQPSIARLESGKAKPSLLSLEMVVEVLGARLFVRIGAPEDAPQAAHCA